MLRMTGGAFRGRRIRSPSQSKTRPTLEKLRQAWFNCIQEDTAEAKVLDLFSGSGALGFEALSRGAAQVVFVESSSQALECIRQNAEDLGVRDRIHIVGRPLEVAFKTVESLSPFDLVFADPPYREGWEMRLLETLRWDILLRPQGLFCLEWGGVPRKKLKQELPEDTPFLVKVREKNYGESILTLYRKKNERAR